MLRCTQPNNRKVASDSAAVETLDLITCVIHSVKDWVLSAIGGGEASPESPGEGAR